MKRHPEGLGAIKSLRPGRAVRLVWEAAPGWTVANAALQVLEGVLPLAALYLIKLLIDAVQAGVTAPDAGGAWRRVLVLVVLAGAVALVTNFSRQFRTLATEAQAQQVTDHVFTLLHAKSVAVDLAYYEDSRFYDTLHRAQRDAPSRPERIVNGLAEMGRGAIGLVGMAALLVVFHWGAALVLFVAAVPGVFLRLRHSVHAYRWARRRTPSERQAWYYHWMLTMDSHAKEVRLFGFGDLIQRRFADLRRLLRGERLSLARKRAGAELVAEVISALATYGTYGFIAYRAVQGAITLGDLVMYYQAFQRGQGFLRDVLYRTAGFYEDSLFLTDLYDFLDLESRVAEPASSTPVPALTGSGVVFDRVSFRYPSTDDVVLHDIDLEIRPGEVIALVGRNGAGKTTLIKLLCRLYDPTAGAISWEGVDLRAFATTDLRGRIAVVPQDFAKYQLTARENIWLGNLALEPSDERVVAAAQWADVHARITSLSSGYETHLGRWFEEGEELSIGEWQKIALARAFLRDAPLVVLDEPTSALDVKSEEAVLNAFRHMVEGRSAVLISHRMSTAKLADRIHVLDAGRIVEVGSHDELLRLGGLYAELFATQSSAYA